VVIFKKIYHTGFTFLWSWDARMGKRDFLNFTNLHDNGSTADFFPKPIVEENEKTTNKGNEHLTNKLISDF